VAQRIREREHPAFQADSGFEDGELEIGLHEQPPVARNPVPMCPQSAIGPRPFLEIQCDIARSGRGLFETRRPHTLIPQLSGDAGTAFGNPRTLAEDTRSRTDENFLTRKGLPRLASNSNYAMF
jgi:hypothetical protein